MRGACSTEGGLLVKYCRAGPPTDISRLASSVARRLPPAPPRWPHRFSGPAVVNSRRRRARNLALQVLFQHDVGRLPIEEALAIAHREHPAADWAFVKTVCTGTVAHAAELDALIEPLLADWSLDRLANVDRTILRLALFELKHTTTPPGVVINEAVELAKRYGTEASGAFVNGVLSAALAAARPPADPQAGSPRPASKTR